MADLPMGYVPELAPDDKVPGIYLKSTTEVGAANSIFYLLVVGQKATSGANITADTQVVDILTDADALYWAGANSEGYRMLLRALSVPGVKIKYLSPAIDTGVAAAATITIDGTWTTTGQLVYRVGGHTIGPIAVSTADTPSTVAAAIAAAINVLSYVPVTAASASGSGTTYVVTLTAASPGARGNQIVVWQDTTGKPSGLTSVLAGGSSTTSGGKYFTGGSGTETMTTLLATTYTQEYFTTAIAMRDSTSLAAWETQIDSKLGPLEGRLECVVTCAVGTLSASGSLSQTTLNNQSFEMLWFEETETPGEELAALFAAMRHQLEIQHPNNRYDRVLLPNVMPQVAITKIPSRSTQVAALNYGLTPIETRNNAAFVVRAVTTRTLTAGGDADNGTIDVAVDRTAKEFRRALKNMLTDHMAANPYLVENPADGDEPDVPAGNTYPANIENEVKLLEYQKQNDNWLAQVAQNPPRCALHPTSVTPRPVLYCPIVVKPLLHQIEGTVALRKFTIAVS